MEVGSLTARDHTPRGQHASLSGTSVPEAYLDVTLSNTYRMEFPYTEGQNILQL